MNRVWITSLAVAHPRYRLSQEEAARRIGEVTGEVRRVSALARGTKIAGRALALTSNSIRALGSIEGRNQIYQQAAPALAVEASAGALTHTPAKPVGFVATSSCTGYMVPGLDVEVLHRLGLAPTTVHLPITEAGCSGGVVALARVADFLRAHSDASGVAVAAEICSIAFQPRTEHGNLTSALLFGDGAGAALMETASETGEGLEVVDSLSFLVEGSQDAIGFALTDGGFYPVLCREVADLLPAPLLEAVLGLLCRHGLDLSDDVAYWLVHPGGPKILEAVQTTFGLAAHDLRWSWQAMSEFGNTSSAAIFDVLHRYIQDRHAPHGWGLVMGLGPGVSIELLLVHR